jgi:hypothetical protein
VTRRRPSATAWTPTSWPASRAALVLSGVAQRDDLRRFGYAPRYVLTGVGDIVA